MTGRLSVVEILIVVLVTLFVMRNSGTEIEEMARTLSRPRTDRRDNTQNWPMTMFAMASLATLLVLSWILFLALN